MMRRFWTLFLSLMLMFAVVAGCGTAASEKAPAGDPPRAEENQAPAGTEAEKAPETRETAYPVTITDDAGREVTIQAEPKRIVSVAPSNTELVFALGKGSALVGRSDFDNYPPEVESIPSIGGFHPPNYEKIVAAEPDLLLMIGGSVEAREKLVNEYNITVYVVDAQTFEELYESIRKLGVVLNAQEQAENVIARMKQEVKKVTDKVAAAKSKPKVFYEVWHDPLMTAGTHTFINDLITLAGGENVGASVEGWSNFSLEQLVAANPDVIIAGSPDAASQVMSRPGWEGIKAVQDGKVFGVENPDLVSRPGPRLVQGLWWMAETLHPELFGQ